MNISIFGLGYVGCVSIGCLAKNGHHLTGVDIQPEKVAQINQGKPTIVEKEIDNLLTQGHASGKIRATADYKNAVRESSLSFVCVGTPSMPTGQLNLDYVFNAIRQIAEGIAEKDSFHIVVVRSTVIPGTCEKATGLLEEITGKKHNVDFAVAANPEFLREGSAVEDYFNPALTVVGCENEKALSMISEIYQPLKAPLVHVETRVAEMIKYVNNSFHALKISFANEAGNICKALGVDAWKVMELFKMDDRLNISPAYFNPGMAYGGSCLPKDLRGLATLAHDHYVKTPVINAIEQSNERQKEHLLELIMKYPGKNVGLLGLAFKKGTDDLRYSPSVNLAESLLGKGYRLKIYDSYVHVAQLTGANKSYVEVHLPHLAQLLCKSPEELCLETDLLIVAHRPDNEVMEIIREFRGVIIDLVNLGQIALTAHKIEGISW